MMPTSRSPSTTGRRRTRRSARSWSARSRSSSGETVARSLEATSPTVVDWGSRPSATTRTTMSRSVRRPTRRSPPTTGIGPTSSWAIALAASATESCEEQLVGFEVITSRTCVTATPPFGSGYDLSTTAKRPTRARSRPSRPRRAAKRIVAPTPPASTNPAPSALAATSGSFPRRRAVTSVASPIPARRSSTAPASCSRSEAMSRRTSSAERPSGPAIANRLRGQLGFVDRLLRHRRRALLDRAQSEQQENRGYEDECGEYDQERQPHVEHDRERGDRGGEAESEREEPEHGSADGKADAEAQSRDLAFD